jgi:hypothetical protein
VHKPYHAGLQTCTQSAKRRCPPCQPSASPGGFAFRSAEGRRSLAIICECARQQPPLTALDSPRQPSALTTGNHFLGTGTGARLDALRFQRPAQARNRSSLKWRAAAAASHEIPCHSIFRHTTLALMSFRQAATVARPLSATLFLKNCTAHALRHGTG